MPLSPPQGSGGSALGVDVETGEIQDGAVTLAKMADLAQDTIIGRSTASTGVPQTIACTAAGRALLDDAAASNQRTTLGLTANGASLVTATDYAAMRALLDLEVGTDFLSVAAVAAAYQPLDSDLTTIAANITAAGHALLDDAAASNQRATLGLGTVSTYTQTYATANRTHETPTAAALTDDSGGGATDGTIGAIGAATLGVGADTVDRGAWNTAFGNFRTAVIDAIAELAAMANKNTADHVDLAQFVNAAVDDLQAKFGEA